MAIYLRPESLDAALAVLADNPALTPVAGATDFYPVRTTRQAWFQPHPTDVLDLSGITKLRGMTQDQTGYRLGALTTWTDILNHPLPPAFDGLKQAARQVGGVQIQNRGTIAGNICNASPAADGLPPLMALDAEVEIANAAGQRKLPLSQFILGNRKTALQRGELVTALHVPMPVKNEQAIFLKLGARHYLVISIASVAANLALDSQGLIEKAQISVGSCSAIPMRLQVLEQALTGCSVNAASSVVTAHHLSDLAPIDDVRATASYRRDAALVLVRRALDQLAKPHAFAPQKSKVA